MPTKTNNMISRGIRNNNPLNIRKGNKWMGLRDFPTDKEFDEFATLQFGFRAAFKLIFTYIQRGDDTIRKIITRWAPPSENDTEGYIRFVKRKSFISENFVLSKEDKYSLLLLVKAMAQMESNYDFPLKIIEEGYNMALKS